MGVPGSGGGRRPSHAAYYVALVGVVGLLAMLCCYFCYYFVKKVNELSRIQNLEPLAVSPRPPAISTAYPVQPVVRDSASAMAKLCKQLPASPAGKDTVFPIVKDTVFPTSKDDGHLTTPWSAAHLGDKLVATVPAAAVDHIDAR